MQPPATPPVAAFRREILQNLHDRVGTDLTFATPSDAYLALAYTVRDRLIQRWLDTLHAGIDSQARFVCYLSAEYLLGRQLDNNLLNTDTEDLAREALADLGLSLDELRDAGGRARPRQRRPRPARRLLPRLPRHARIPAIGYGIRYEFGIFRQTFEDGWQVEEADDWLRRGNPWEFPHPEMAIEVGFGGHTEGRTDQDGRYRVRWLPDRTVLGVPYNTMVPGYGSGAVNTLRLWRARATELVRPRVFNAGDYTRAVHQNTAVREHHQGALPRGQHPAGQAAAPGAAVLLRRLLPQGRPPDRPDHGRLDRAAARAGRLPAQRHPPRIAVAELMRLLVDEYDLDWEPAWAITRRSSPTPATPCCPRRWRLAGRPLRAGAAPPPRDHLRDQPALPGRGPRPLPRRRRPHPAACR